MQQEGTKTGATDFIKSKYARGFFSKYKWSYIIGMIILITIDIAQVRVPMIVGEVIDGIDARTITENDFNRAIITMGIIALVVMIGRVTWRYCIFGAARKVERDMRNDLFSHLLTFIFSFRCGEGYARKACKHC